MNPDEVLAVFRLRQWAYDRVHMKSGHLTDYRREGWHEHRARESDTRIVRVLDFERALSRLRQEYQSMLILTYRDHLDQHTVAIAAGTSLRALAYKLPAKP
jgi:hypothetical protein